MQCFAITVEKFHIKIVIVPDVTLIHLICIDKTMETHNRKLLTCCAQLTGMVFEKVNKETTRS